MAFWFAKPGDTQQHAPLKRFDPAYWTVNFPRPMINRPGLDFSFSGLKTYVRNTITSLRDESGELAEQDAADIARAFEEAVVNTLSIKCRRALEETGYKKLIIAGGVSANLRLREVLEEAMAKVDGRLFYAQLKYCTDNGAMIAFAGAMRLQYARTAGSFTVKPRWDLSSLPKA